MYKIIRMYQDERQDKIVRTNLTLEEAQIHCRSKETSSTTCSIKMTKQELGVWFDAYNSEEN